MREELEHDHNWQRTSGRGAERFGAPPPHSGRKGLQSLALATKTRPLRFAAVGGLCGLLQLALLLAFKRLAIDPIGANVGAYLCSRTN